MPGIREVSLEELLSCSDVFSINCPLTARTQGSIANMQIAQMKQGAILLNTASGKIVCQSDVLSALDAGKLAFYLADVMAQEPPESGDALLHHPRSIFTPHLAWAPLETRRRLASIAVSNVRAYLEGSVENQVTL